MLLVIEVLADHINKPSIVSSSTPCTSFTYLVKVLQLVSTANVLAITESGRLLRRRVKVFCTETWTRGSDPLTTMTTACKASKLSAVLKILSMLASSRPVKYHLASESTHKHSNDTIQ